MSTTNCRRQVESLPQEKPTTHGCAWCFTYSSVVRPGSRHFLDQILIVGRDLIRAHACAPVVACRGKPARKKGPGKSRG